MTELTTQSEIIRITSIGIKACGTSSTNTLLSSFAGVKCTDILQYTLNAISVIIQSYIITASIMVPGCTLYTYHTRTVPLHKIKRRQSSTEFSSTGRSVGQSINTTDLLLWLTHALLTLVPNFAPFTLLSSTTYFSVATATHVTSNLWQ